MMAGAAEDFVLLVKQDRRTRLFCLNINLVYEIDSFISTTFLFSLKKYKQRIPSDGQLSNAKTKSVTWRKLFFNFFIFDCSKVFLKKIFL